MQTAGWDGFDPAFASIRPTPLVCYLIQDVNQPNQIRVDPDALILPYLGERRRGHGAANITCPGRIADRRRRNTSDAAPATPPKAATARSKEDSYDAMIQNWIDGWLAKDAEAVAALYAEDGTYADAAYPFEYRGRSEIEFLVRTHTYSPTYTVAKPLNVSYTDTGAVVDWLWEGTIDGTGFSMNASTTFEIEEGLITRSTDSYTRADAPW